MLFREGKMYVIMVEICLFLFYGDFIFQMRMIVSFCLSLWMFYRILKKWIQRIIDLAFFKFRRIGLRSVSIVFIYMIINFYLCGEIFVRYVRVFVFIDINIFYYKLVFKYLWYYNFQIMYILIRKICWCELFLVNCEIKLS